VFFTIRPRCSLILGSTNSRKRALRRSCVPSSSAPISASNRPHLAEAESGEFGLTPLYPSAADLIVDIETPSREVLTIDDPALLENLSGGLDATHALSLLRSDCRPVSLFSIHTVRQIGDEVGVALDKRRFRANIYADLTPMSGFAENTFVARRLQILAELLVNHPFPRVELENSAQRLVVRPDEALPVPADLVDRKNRRLQARLLRRVLEIRHGHSVFGVVHRTEIDPAARQVRRQFLPQRDEPLESGLCI